MAVGYSNPKGTVGANPLRMTPSQSMVNSLGVTSQELNQGQPTPFAYVPGWNSGDSILPAYQKQVQQNSGALNTEKSMAMNQGENPWAASANLQQEHLAETNRDNGAQSVASQTAQANDALAAQGGLSSGARERVAEGGMKNYIGMTQDNASKLDAAKLGIATTDQNNKIGMLGDVAGKEQQETQGYTNAAEYDAAQKAAETGRLNSYNQFVYGQQMTNYAAAMQADATAKSGKK